MCVVLVAYLFFPFFPKVTPFWSFCHRRWVLMISLWMRSWLLCRKRHFSHVKGRMGILQDDPWVHGSLSRRRSLASPMGPEVRSTLIRVQRPVDESSGVNPGDVMAYRWHIHGDVLENPHIYIYIILYYILYIYIHIYTVYIISGWIIMTSLWRHWKDVFFSPMGNQVGGFVYVQFNWFSDSLEGFFLWIKNIILISRWSSLDILLLKNHGGFLSHRGYPPNHQPFFSVLPWNKPSSY